MKTSHKFILLAVTGMLLNFGFGTGCSWTKMDESTTSVKHITPDEFNTEVSSSTLPVVVDLYATWCGPCRAFSPIVDGLASTYTNQIKFVKINLDDAPDLAKKYSVEAIPTLLFFKQGELKDRTLGLMEESALKARLDAFVAAK